MDGAERLSRLHVALQRLEGGHHRQAEQLCRELLSDNRDDVEALLILGLAIGMRGEAATAAAVLNQVAGARPSHAHPCADLARMLAAQGKAGSILPQYRACLALTPDDRRLRYGLAECLRESGDGEAAVSILAPILLAGAVGAEAHEQMGMALAECGRFAEAAEHFRAAITCDPEPAGFWANLGMMLKVEGQFDAALEAYDEALARAPANHQIRVNRAVARLHAGRFAEAWQDPDWTLLGSCSALPADRLLPPLSRLPGLTGQTVLVVQEEGFGDTLQFMRYLPLLADRGARVAVAVPSALTRLLRTVPGVSEAPDGEAPVPDYHFHCSFNALPRAFETTLETIPAAVPYLAADPLLVRDWAAKLLLPADKLRVGLCWAGQARPWLEGFAGLDQRRSTSLSTLAPLATVPDVQFVSLQKGPASAEARENGFDLLDVMDTVRDFADTAGIVANLDLVISVDTSIVHLAGAMGKPVFLLDRYDNCWRWLSGREDSPWYPSLRIFRQHRSGEWGPVITRVATALAAAAARPSRPPGLPNAA